MPLDERIKHRLKLRDLNVLATVIQSGSMGKAAAARAGISPSTARILVLRPGCAVVRARERT